jgi:hypothetical protein
VFSHSAFALERYPCGGSKYSGLEAKDLSIIGLWKSCAGCRPVRSLGVEWAEAVDSGIRIDIRKTELEITAHYQRVSPLKSVLICECVSVSRPRQIPIMPLLLHDGTFGQANHLLITRLSRSLTADVT